VTPESAFQSYLEGALETLGIEADETERLVMAGVYELYQPGLQALLDADLDEVEPELRVDLSQAPPR
jgi:hypothetical protein